MNKKDKVIKSDISSADKRKEIVNKVKLDKIINDDKVKKVKVNLVDTQSLNFNIKDSDVLEINNEVKRSEIFNKIANNNFKKTSEKFLKLSDDELKKVLRYRSEIFDKFNLDKNSVSYITKKDNKKDLNINNKFEYTLELNKLIENVEIKALDEIEKRTEILGKFSDNKEVKINDKVEYDFNDNEIEELKDDVQENVENISIAMIILIIVICSIVGTIIGYMLYRIAISNSNDILFNCVFRSLHIFM